jgi:hypothetical protein
MNPFSAFVESNRVPTSWNSAHRGIGVTIESFLDHYATRDLAEVVGQHLGSVFISRCPTSIVSWSTSRAPNMIDKSVHGRCRGGSVRR